MKMRVTGDGPPVLLLHGLGATGAVWDGLSKRPGHRWLAPDLPGLLRAARCPVGLAAGEHDPMSRPEHLRALGAEPSVIPRLGHNAHVEDPDALLGLLTR